MKMESISLLEWQNRFGSEEACAEALKKVRWPDGFICPECAGKKFSYITLRRTPVVKRQYCPPNENLGFFSSQVISSSQVFDNCSNLGFRSGDRQVLHQTLTEVPAAAKRRLRKACAFCDLETISYPYAVPFKATG